MKIKEFYKDKILEIACERNRVAAKKDTGEVCRCCKDLSCKECVCWGFRDCKLIMSTYLNKEYVEPCPFEKDELVEVSNNGRDWLLRHFSNIGDGYYGKFMTYDFGMTSEETKTTSSWTYCQKYGTLGGLVEGEE